jgi:hypothetical protein
MPALGALAALDKLELTGILGSDVVPEIFLVVPAGAVTLL